MMFGKMLTSTGVLLSLVILGFVFNMTQPSNSTIFIVYALGGLLFVYLMTGSLDTTFLLGLVTLLGTLTFVVDRFTDVNIPKLTLLMIASFIVGGILSKFLDKALGGSR